MLALVTLLVYYILLPIVIILGLVVIVCVLDHHLVVKPIQDKAVKLQNEEDNNKNGFSQDKVLKLGKVDAIVIGSGLGGLTTAGLLARRGKKVLVLEQHDVAGGCTHTFTTKQTNGAHEKVGGYEYDTGLHYVGGDVGIKSSPFGFLFYVITQGYLKWTKLGASFDKASISPILSSQRVPKQSSGSGSVDTGATAQDQAQEGYDFCEDTDSGYIQAFSEKFPDANPENFKKMNNLYRWIEIIMPIYSTLKMMPLWLYNIVGVAVNFFLLPLIGTSTYDMMKTCTTDSQLMGVMTYCYGDYVSIRSDLGMVFGCCIVCALY